MSAELTDEQLAELFRGQPIDHDTAAVFRGRLDGKLLVHRCDDCGTWHQPPKPICPHCWSTAVTPTPVRGTGTIFMAIFLHQGPPADGVDYATPHPVVTVELDEQEGLRYTSTVVGTSNADIHIGDRVELDWIERGDAPLPVFRLAKDVDR